MRIHTEPLKLALNS